MQKLTLFLGLALICVALVEGQSWLRQMPRRRHPRPPTCELNFKNDVYSMFYWKGYENICEKSLCFTYPWLKCGIDKTHIINQALGHEPEDVMMEIEYLKKYFNTMIPQPKNILPYSCQGVCHENAKSLQLERLFVNVPTKNPLTNAMEEQRLMCIVIGPDIFYQQCNGTCQIPYGGSGNSYCVPDVVVTIDIWVFCPEAKPKKCHKVKFDVPLSCSCKRFRCLKDIPPKATDPFSPVLPPMPLDWDPANPGFPIDPVYSEEEKAFKMQNGLVGGNVGIPLGPHVPIKGQHVGVSQIGSLGGQHVNTAGGIHGKPVGGQQGWQMDVSHGGQAGGPIPLGHAQVGQDQIGHLGLDPLGHSGLDPLGHSGLDPHINGK